MHHPLPPRVMVVVSGPRRQKVVATTSRWWGQIFSDIFQPRTFIQHLIIENMHAHQTQPPLQWCVIFRRYGDNGTVEWRHQRCGDITESMKRVEGKLHHYHRERHSGYQSHSSGLPTVTVFRLLAYTTSFTFVDSNSEGHG